MPTRIVERIRGGGAAAGGVGGPAAEDDGDDDSDSDSAASSELLDFSDEEDMDADALSGDIGGASVRANPQFRGFEPMGRDASTV